MNYLLPPVPLLFECELPRMDFIASTRIALKFGSANAFGSIPCPKAIEGDIKFGGKRGGRRLGWPCGCEEVVAF